MALGNLRDEYPAIPIMALTATAKMNVVDDIIHRLKMHEPVRLKESFNRPNLHYDVRPKPRNVLNEVANFITSKYPNKCGIIYALSRNSCEEIAKNLREKYSLKAKHYHAKMSPQDKHETQAAWKSGKCDIIVATVRAIHCNRPLDANNISSRLPSVWELINPMVNSWPITAGLD
jgi:bloom syndrome protein